MNISVLKSITEGKTRVMLFYSIGEGDIRLWGELYGVWPKGAVWPKGSRTAYGPKRAVWPKGSRMAQRELYGVWPLYGPKGAVWSKGSCMRLYDLILKHSCCEKSKTLTLVARQGMRISLFSTEFAINSWKASSQLCKLRYFQALSR